ncbi:hypothetical protein JVT61DRAFT_14200 [Boletus reticuloceps]|uniref:Uncharacterized protein n=1 Tax=Boletus reticuloceps TaxID=495285 RepID=A0A8I3A2S1_9AGAM|nr:hypothetical protein JVT61DRAFT_14200 [Boletus reticuloceps]
MTSAERMSQQQESTPSTSALKGGDSTTSTKATGKFAYLQPYARSKFSPRPLLLYSDNAI